MTKNKSGTRERLIQAALQHFALYGYEGASTRQIAQTAGENQGSITYHFGNKENLWKESVSSLLGGFREQLMARIEVLADADLRTRIRLLSFFFVRYAAEHPEQMQLLVQEGKSENERSTWLVENHLKPMFTVLSALGAEAQEAGVLPRIPPIHLFYILTGATSLIFTHTSECKLLSGRSPLEPDMIEAHAESVCTFLLGS